MLKAYQKLRKETEDWNDFKRLPEELPEYPLIRRMSVGAESVVQTPGVGASETDERRIAAFSTSMNPCFIRKVQQHTQFAYVEESTRRSMHNTATPKPGRFEAEWVALKVALLAMRGKVSMGEAAVIVIHVRSELVAI